MSETHPIVPATLGDLLFTVYAGPKVDQFPDRRCAEIVQNGEAIRLRAWEVPALALHLVEWSESTMWTAAQLDRLEEAVEELKLNARGAGCREELW